LTSLLLCQFLLSCLSVQAHQEIWKLGKLTYNHEAEHQESKEDYHSGWTFKCTLQITMALGLMILCVRMISEE
jgi:hypothetical protein